MTPGDQVHQLFRDEIRWAARAQRGDRLLVVRLSDDGPAPELLVRLGTVVGRSDSRLDLVISGDPLPTPVTAHEGMTDEGFLLRDIRVCHGLINSYRWYRAEHLLATPLA